VEHIEEYDGKLLGTWKEHSGKQGKPPKEIPLPPSCPPPKPNRKRSKAPWLQVGPSHWLHEISVPKWSSSRSLESYHLSLLNSQTFHSTQVAQRPYSAEPSDSSRHFLTFQMKDTPKMVRMWQCLEVEDNVKCSLPHLTSPRTCVWQTKKSQSCKRDMLL